MGFGPPTSRIFPRRCQLWHASQTAAAAAAVSPHPRMGKRAEEIEQKVTHGPRPDLEDVLALDGIAHGLERGARVGRSRPVVEVVPGAEAGERDGVDLGRSCHSEDRG